MIKILFISQLPPPFHGAATLNAIALDIIKCISHPEVINLSIGNTAKKIGKLSLNRTLYSTKNTIKLLKLLLTQKFHFCYFTPNFLGPAFYRDLIIISILKFFKSNIILHFHGLGANTRNRFLARLMLKDTYCIHVSKTVLKTELSDFIDYTRDQTFVTNGAAGCPIHLANRLRKCFDPINLVHLANLRESKGTFDVLRIAAFLKEKSLNFHIDIIGNFRNESFRNKCLAFIEDNELSSNIDFYGELTGEDKFNILSNAHFMLYPTYNDSFGLVIVEALSAGVPVICYREGSTEEIITDGKNGFIFNKGDYKSMANTLILFSKDTSSWEEYSKASIESFLSKYTIEEYRESLGRTLTKIINSDRSTGIL